MITLYVKTHKKTGMKYFGKTTKKDPFQYNGSGKYWIKHLKKHGYDVITEIIGRYETQEECKKVALDFSKKNNIVESNEWANLRIENGIDGAPVGNTFSSETIKRMSEIKKNKFPKEYYIQLAKKRVGFKQSEYQKQKVKELFQQLWIVTCPKGKKQKIINLRQFCLKNNLDQGNMVKVSKGLLKKHKGWSCQKAL